MTNYWALKRAAKELLDTQISRNKAVSAAGQTSSPGPFRFLHHKSCKQVRGYHEAGCPKQTEDLLNPPHFTFGPLGAGISLARWRRAPCFGPSSQSSSSAPSARSAPSGLGHGGTATQTRGWGGTGTTGREGMPATASWCWGKLERAAPRSSSACRGIKVKNNTGRFTDLHGGQFFPPPSPTDQVKSRSKSVSPRALPVTPVPAGCLCRSGCRSPSSRTAPAARPCPPACPAAGRSAGEGGVSSEGRPAGGTRGALGRTAPRRAAGRAGTATSEGSLAGTIAAAAAGEQGRTWQREAQGSLSDPSRGRNPAINALLKERRVI